MPSTNEPSGSVSGKTTWTLLLYLTSATEGCAGGETTFYPHNRQSEKEALSIAPETGMLLLHKHGDDCLLVSDFLPPFVYAIHGCTVELLVRGRGQI